MPDHGGDTVWSNQYLAYETLSNGLKSTLDGLRAVHSAGLAYGTGGLLDQVKDLTSMAIAPSAEAYAEHVHPVVTVHPVTAKRVLFVNPIYTVRFQGWTKEESQTLLAHLYRHSINENFTCRLRWSVKTLAIWDNRCTMHNALNDYSGVRREMYRTSVKGSAPAGVGSSASDQNERGRPDTIGQRPARQWRRDVLPSSRRLCVRGSAESSRCSATPRSPACAPTLRISSRHS